ncbi:tetrahydrodipicolinate N-succinyltransferase N-terminal domain-containing protein [Fluviispira sanaruensis]|uniref:2,3,4,5-tetrahydropyridine-2,6-dicarboxylate N-succinyltransferase n=1 Tax=Fluviispira sanaruensis TaxID=2493639 RepID=A0A4P2VNB4_FLUSA|nr:tetrahydrodipicolinate N-succinyltransferase N-terminal domain-containing protein [Fluviispira sanaruensis]BBH54571.1 2,3,4,5-tetrahydropyridine-2,6-dicarboxylate N-succinyltransferase [Fluviispira sanaruensis]
MLVKDMTEFKKIIENIEKNKDYIRPQAFAIGIATLAQNGTLLDCYFPSPNFQTNFATAAILANVLGYKNGTHSYQLTNEQITEILSYFTPFANDGKEHANIELLKNLQKIMQNPIKNRKAIVVSFITSSENDTGPKSVPDAYLRLHLLSHRFVKPHCINLTGIFNILPNVVWTSEGAIAAQDLNLRKMEAICEGRNLVVHSIDKFPRMTDYVTPTGVRIADASRVRLGAYLGDGTTVMHEGFVNFNAGCEGPNMIEGRISAGVFVKKGSDLGGGCSTMGTLSGGGNIIISIGENCLLGANSGLGIPLGDRCTIEAGLYITAGTKVLFNNTILKAKDFAGKNDILFRRNSQSGCIEAISKANSVELNTELHNN